MSKETGVPRKVKKVITARPMLEGAGVRLMRVFGAVDPDLDPFLLLDHFGSRNPDDYMAGFPWHPHRGIETITYLHAGSVEHGDSLGNKGVIGAGDVQWMTAGSGIIHQEMPQRADVLDGFQLWANLPKSHKMMPPRYRDVPQKSLTDAVVAEGVTAKVICGQLGEVSGPVRDIVTDPLYADLQFKAGAQVRVPIPSGHNAFVYLYRGTLTVDQRALAEKQMAVLQRGDYVLLSAAEEAGALLVAGRPIGEPVAWGGPIVMNTEEELQQAMREYREGTFIK